MRTVIRATLSLALVVGAFIATAAGPANAATRTQMRPAANQIYHVWATNVNLRANEANQVVCSNFPSTTNCPNIRQRVQPDHVLYVYCQKIGQKININPYWVLVNDFTQPNTGWLASYYIDYPANRLPDVPDCP